MGPGIQRERERRFTFDIQRFDFVYLYRFPYFLNVICVDLRNKKAVFSKTFKIVTMVTIASDSTAYTVAAVSKIQLAKCQM